MQLKYTHCLCDYSKWVDILGEHPACVKREPRTVFRKWYRNQCSEDEKKDHVRHDERFPEKGD